jgi:small-conductance mechanosensitive channel
MLNPDEAMEKIQAMLTDWASAVPLMVLGVVAFVLMMALNRAIANSVRKGVEKGTEDKEAADSIARLIRLLLGAVALLLSASIAFPSFSLESVAATLGLSSIAIGFAFKDIFENFLAGVFILLRRPFHVGDEVEVKGKVGVVKAIEMRSTTIEGYNKDIYVLPNAFLFKDAVRVITENSVRRFSADLSVPGGSEFDRVEAVLVSAIAGVEGALADPPPKVYWNTPGAKIGLTVDWWVDSEKTSPRQVRSEVVQSLQRALVAAELS